MKTPEDKAISDFFIRNNFIVSDGSYATDVLRRLPRRNSILPYIIAIIFLTVGLIVGIWFDGIAFLIENMQILGAALADNQLPSFTLMAIYFGGLSLLSSICFAAYRFFY